MVDSTESARRRRPWYSLRKHFGNFSFLLAVLLILILVHPFVSGRTQREFFTAGFTAALLAGLYGIRGEGTTLRTGLILVTPAILGTWAAYLVDAQWLEPISYVFETVFLVYVTFVILRYIMTEREITGDTVWGAMSAYIMIGLIFAFAYSWLDRFAPGSFHGIASAGSEKIWEFIYFSMVTMTTLGYGDVTPVHESARAVATIEAVLGQFFVAVLVARIVAIWSTKPASR